MKSVNARPDRVIWVILFSVMIGATLWYALQDRAPAIGVRLTGAVEGMNYTAVWRVTNHSDQTVHFSNYKIGLGELTAVSYKQPIKSAYQFVSLEPGEFYEEKFCFFDLKPAYYNISTTATCIEGTSGTYQAHFVIERP